MYKLLTVAVFAALSLTEAYCPNGCSGHGTCGLNDKCTCYTKKDDNAAVAFSASEPGRSYIQGDDVDLAWTGHDCSERTCPMREAWASIPSTNDHGHERAECSNKGTCDKKTGLCKCFDNYEGDACERTTCPNDCSGRGICVTAKQLAAEAGKVYATPWDAVKQQGCVCDIGFRGPDCSLRECPSDADVMGGDGNAQGRDCSGRGICDYATGICTCFSGYYGAKCQQQTVLY
jgi:hypothetical protein